MEILFKRSEFHTRISYGELLATSVKQQSVQTKHVIVLTNQRYYDRFFQKIKLAFPDKIVDWYICRNQLYCNNLEELKDVLLFLSKFAPCENYLLIAFGNEGVMQLAGFLQKTMLLEADFWAIPASFSAMFAALAENRIICQQPYRPMMMQKNLPARLFLDQTIIQKQHDGKLVDLQCFIEIALLSEPSLLDQLYATFPTRRQLETASLTAFIAPAVRAYEKSAVSQKNFGQVFEQAFYLTANGHLLSAYMKRFLAIILQFNWNVTTFAIDFQLEKFMIWLKRLGFPLELPEQLSTAEYLEKVVDLQRDTALATLKKIGQLGPAQKADGKSLLQAMDQYQKIISKI